MRILHLLDERWDSGLTAYALQIAALLQKSGHAVAVGVLAGRKPETLAKSLGLDTRPVDSLFDLRKLIRNGSWDAINVHTGRMHSWALVFKPSHVPVVRTRGDARPVKANLVSRFVYRRTAAVIAASAHIAGYYEEDFGLSENKLHVIYPSVAVPENWEAPPADRVGILGRLDPVKGHAYFLEAVVDILKERPQTKFFIAGKEANIRYELLANQMRELGIQDAVSYVGFQPSALQFMKSCSVGVIASIGSEEISRACLEWMAAGRPVVGTLVGCLPELVEPTETGFLVAPGDGLAMGDAILKLLRDTNVAHSFGKNAQALARKKFGTDAELKNTLAVYEKVANRSR